MLNVGAQHDELNRLTADELGIVLNARGLYHLMIKYQGPLNDLARWGMDTGVRHDIVDALAREAGQGGWPIYGDKLTDADMEVFHDEVQGWWLESGMAEKPQDATSE